jgi:ribosomal protein S18 acetylase RimI-like enzyme
MATVAVARERAGVVARPVTDRLVLRAFLERDRLWAAYAICDLEDQEFRRTRWGGAWEGDRLVAVAVEYAGPTPQPLFAMGSQDGIDAILRDVLRPRAAYIATRTDVLGAVSRNYRLEPAVPMVRMWVDRERFRPRVEPAVRRLGPSEVGDLNRLYRLGFASWLPSTAITEGVYYGLRIGGRLVSAAGTHVVSPRARLAVVGNVLTSGEHRGRGYAQAVTAAVTETLLEFCDQVVLNVRSDNPPALQAYRAIGYTEYCRFEERLGHRLEAPWSGWMVDIRRMLGRGKDVSSR